MQKLQESLQKLDVSIKKTINKNKELIRQNEELKIELQWYKEKLNQTIREKTSIEQENKNLKVVSAFSGNDQHKRLMKIKLNRLIKEIDGCIFELKNS
jgi:chromosome segregation ATPase